MFFLCIVSQHLLLVCLHASCDWLVTPVKTSAIDGLGLMPSHFRRERIRTEIDFIHPADSIVQ